MSKVTCHKCEQKVSMASGRTIDGQEVDLCGVCDGYADPCRGCYSHDVVREVEPGCFLCKICIANRTPEQKRATYEREYAELLESGHPMADEMPMPSNWR